MRPPAQMRVVGRPVKFVGARSRHHSKPLPYSAPIREPCWADVLGLDHEELDNLEKQKIIL